MDIDAAATFFVGTILVGLGVVVVSLVLLLLNNLFNKYWKPVKFSVYHFPHSNHIDYNEPVMGNVETSNTEVSNTTIQVKK